jgi:bacteriophage N4 adsorption protein B
LSVPLLDHCVASSLVPLAVWILISGLDDLFLDLVIAWNWFRCRFLGAPRIAPPSDAELGRTPEKRVAVFVPLWREHRVISRMLENNLASIRYSNYNFFIGAYPNDELTADAVREAEARFPNVHLGLCPHDGPTSKADCLNWIYQRMLIHEERNGIRFEVVVLHDAEDLIHPEELRWINYYIGSFGMVQIPVLPLPTPARKFTHGVYCDEFAEYQSKDLPARQLLGGFIPSSGVGTGYARWALEKLAELESNRVFDPGSLTEDYDSGFRLHRLGCPQRFVPIRMVAGEPVATREYFPDGIRRALRQRARWVTGIALQAWERHGWRGGWRQAYWLWRDRKGLIGNPVTLLANAVLVYGLATWLWSWHTGGQWGVARAAAHPAAALLLWTMLFLGFERLAVRCGCVARLYGWRSALAVPLRVFWANSINFLATVSALGRYTAARVRGRPLGWVKTEHSYPSRAALNSHQRRLGEILVGSSYIGEQDLQAALASKAPDVRTGEHLIALGLLSEQDLYEALSLQHMIPFLHLEGWQVPLWIARALPAAEARRWKVLPFNVRAGRLYVAGPELPTDQMRRELRKHTGLEIQFHFITPGNLRELTNQLLGRASAAS